MTRGKTAVHPKREMVNTMADERELTLLCIDGFDEAILGLAGGSDSSPAVAYSVQKIIKHLMDDGLSREDAYEHFSFNIEGAYMGEGTPIFVEEDIE